MKAIQPVDAQIYLEQTQANTAMLHILCTILRQNERVDTQETIAVIEETIESFTGAGEPDVAFSKTMRGFARTLSSAEQDANEVESVLAMSPSPWET